MQLASRLSVPVLSPAQAEKGWPRAGGCPIWRCVGMEGRDFHIRRTVLMTVPKINTRLAHPVFSCSCSASGSGSASRSDCFSKLPPFDCPSLSLWGGLLRSGFYLALHFSNGSPSDFPSLSFWRGLPRSRVRLALHFSSAARRRVRQRLSIRNPPRLHAPYWDRTMGRKQRQLLLHYATCLAQGQV